VGIIKPAVATDAEAVALVRGVVETHARLGARQHEAETRAHCALEAPYQAWVRVRSRDGFSDLQASSEEVAQVKMPNITLFFF